MVGFFYAIKHGVRKAETFLHQYEYDREMVKDELLIPNDIGILKASQYELTGYINDVNTGYTQVLMEFGSNGRWSNVYDYGVQRNSVNIKNGEKAYYLYDGRGSVANLTSQRGASMVYYEYIIYGEADASRAGVHNPYRHNAEYTDAVTGLQYLRARYYDPETSRFMTKDTYLGEINDPLSRSLYTYTRNNPINLIDPSGHLFGLIIGLITVGVATYGTYRAVSDRNEQAAQIRNQQASYESQATVQENVTTRPQNLRAPTSADQVGSFSYYNERDNKVVTFTTAAAYYEYKKLCEDLDKLDKELASNIVHNTLDAVGVIPGVGEVADAANAAIYFAEGDTTNAALSLVSLIPAAGDLLGKGGRTVDSFIGVSDDVADAVSDISKNSDEVDDLAGDLPQSAASSSSALNGVENSLNGLPQNKGYSSFDALKRDIGSPGPDKQWHHIVEQSQIQRSGFSSEQIKIHQIL